MDQSSDRPRGRVRAAFRHAQVVVAAVVFGAAAVVIVLTMQNRGSPKVHPAADTEVSSQAKRVPRFVPTPAQWASLGIETVQPVVFRSGFTTEGKIAINEERSTPVFPPYAGRVTRLMAKPGDAVQQGTPLFYIEAADMVQAQNDFLAAVGVLNKARSQVTIAEIIEKQNRSLYESKAGPLRDYQTAQAALVQARADQRNAEAAVEAARNRLMILGKTAAEIQAFQDQGTISSETPIYAPLSGTVVQRKIGPGQYVSYVSTGMIEPVYTIGNLSTVWLVAYLREADAPKAHLGQQIDFTVLAYPNTTFTATVDHVAASLDPATHRLMVRATIDNSAGRFKPEMFASVRLYNDDGDRSVAVSRDAVIHEADNARVWVVRPDKSIELRRIKTGITSGNHVQVLQGLQPGEMVVTKGSLFVDQAAGS